MHAPIGSVSSVGVMAMLCAMFVIVLVCVQKAVKKMAFFSNTAGWAVAFCVALLSIIGLVKFFGPAEAVAAPARVPREASGLLDVVLLPYVALALTVFLVLLLLAVSRVLHGREPWRRWEPARSLRTTAKPRMRRGRNLRKETRPPKSTEERAISVSKNTAIGKKTERTRFDS